jgi:hypothetical protein
MPKIIVFKLWNIITKSLGSMENKWKKMYPMLLALSEKLDCIPSKEVS